MEITTTEENFNNVLLVQKVTDTAIIPTKAHESDAGYDLYSDEDVLIPKWSRACISTGLIISVPNDCYGRIAARSGLACNYSIDVSAGVIDVNYRGLVKICLVNSSDNEYQVKKGAKIAQLICERISYPKLICVNKLDTDTDRGNKGFGSSGY